MQALKLCLVSIAHSLIKDSVTIHVILWNKLLNGCQILKKL